ncbi:MAG: alpha/beta hydrolase-fold protein [Bryobacteraceae bacterium]|nr:alpha/beta hydrolase-fold protein [Bryobacteraceae bacterium]
MHALVFLLAADFSVSFPASRSTQPLDGRLLILLSTDSKAEPRFQINDGPNTQMVFGVDVENWKPGAPWIVDAKAFGWPVRSLSQVKPGEYYVQALLHRYETFRRADGHTVKLPMDRGEGQQWNRAPGNLHSKPTKLTVGAAGRIAISLTEEIPPIVPPKDTKYIRHERIESKLLTQFWGRPMHLGAHILLPEGFDEHPEARYPLAIFHGHFPSDFDGFRTTPPDDNLKPDYSERFKLSGYNRIQQQEAYDFYKKWTSPGFPRVIVIEIQHANPFYDDSYAVNSANLGPYGDAIMTELLPYLEKKYRAIGQGWARFTYGGSTGGWEALAVQTFYPDEFNGAFVACPDPIDFRAFTTIELYKDKNAYYVDGAHRRVPRPAHRDYLGHVSAMQEDSNYYELALGTKSRSGQQYDIWEAVYSPVGPDGYPARIFDKLTGAIDPKVAAYWRENYDLRHILERDWAKLGPKVRGKIHLYCGDMDNYYLNNAVYLMEDFLKKAANPPADAEVAYGDRAEHCWNGDPNLPNAISRLRYNMMYLPKMLRRMDLNHPPGADMKSWRY